MASGSEPSPSPSLGCMRQPCLLLPAQPQPGGRCDRSWSPGGQQDRVGTPTALAVPAAAPWDQDDTVELGTGKGTLTHPIPGHLVWPREPCVCTAPGSLQPAELSSDTHACTHTCAHTDTCTHTYVYTHTGTQTCMRTHTHTHTHRCCSVFPQAGQHSGAHICASTATALRVPSLRVRTGTRVELVHTAHAHTGPCSPAQSL